LCYYYNISHGMRFAKIDRIESRKQQFFWGRI